MGASMKQIHSKSEFNEFHGILKRRALGVNPDIQRTVADILQAVEQNGDEAVRDFTQRFDGIALDSFRLPQETID
ncbi:Histidinol dehydrogenase, prokaryotic-type, partial [Candidatus Magnetobacterium bavaricum]